MVLLAGFVVPHLGFARDFRIAEVNDLERATEVVLTREAAPLDHTPGQVALVAIQGKGRPKPHPFTITSAPGAEPLRFTVKVLADWTGKVRKELQPGGRVLVRGSCGRFDLSRAGPKQIWLADGVGLTALRSAIRATRLGTVIQVALFADEGKAAGLAGQPRVFPPHPRPMS